MNPLGSTIIGISEPEITTMTEELRIEDLEGAQQKLEQTLHGAIQKREQFNKVTSRHFDAVNERFDVLLNMLDSIHLQLLKMNKSNINLEEKLSDGFVDLNENVDENMKHYDSQVEHDFIEVDEIEVEEIEVEDKSVDVLNVTEVKHGSFVIELEKLVPSLNLKNEIVLNIGVNELLLELTGWKAPKRKDGIGVSLLGNDLKCETIGKSSLDPLHSYVSDSLNYARKIELFVKGRSKVELGRHVGSNCSKFLKSLWDRIAIATYGELEKNVSGFLVQEDCETVAVSEQGETDLIDREIWSKVDYVVEFIQFDIYMPAFVVMETEENRIEKVIEEKTIGHNLEGLSLLIGGIVYSNAVVTVSPTYLKETLCSGRLAAMLIRHRDKYFVILNGIDTAIWKPATDAFLSAKFDANQIEGKKICKLVCLFLAQEAHDSAEVPLVVCITRLVAQKGFHLITNAIRHVEIHGGQMVILGTAPDARVGSEFEGLAQLHNQFSSIRILLMYSEELSHMLYAAADIVLVPSIYEPCGLSQMIGMRYGAVPVVKKTRGLADTVVDMDDQSPLEIANGFVFEEIDEGSLNCTLDRAISYYQEKPDEWKGMVKKNNVGDGLKYIHRKFSSLDPRGRGSYQPGGIVMNQVEVNGGGGGVKKKGLAVEFELRMKMLILLILIWERMEMDLGCWINYFWAARAIGFGLKKKCCLF